MGLGDLLYGNMGGPDVMSPEQQEYAKRMGLMGLAAKLLQAGSPSPVKQNLAGALGQGLQGGVEGINSAVNQMRMGAGTNMIAGQNQAMRGIGAGLPQELQSLTTIMNAMKELERRKKIGSNQIPYYLNPNSANPGGQ